MSKLIDNREYRQKVLKEMITELHDGASVDDVKQKFEETFDGVSASEISEVEQALIRDGMPVSEVQRLCDVHSAVFKGSIEQIHMENDPSSEAGHPLEVMKRENRAIETLINGSIRPHLESGDNAALAEDLKQLSTIDLHYKRKENILFPYLEKYGITAPPKVMWGVDDEIRALIKDAQTALGGDMAALKAAVELTLDRVGEMIFKEDNILAPMALESLVEDEWKRIADDGAEIGYCLIDDVPAYTPSAKRKDNVAPAKTVEGNLSFPTGVLSLREAALMLNTLPFDITFVDASDTVKYFSDAADRIFPRTKAIIGRKVSACHPPSSVHVVEGIVADLKSGKKDHEDFWIKLGETFAYIRYFAVRGEGGEYVGTLEVSQNIAPIQEITGEKRLVTD